MSDIELRLKSDNSLISDRCKEWSGWTPLYEQPDPVTVAGVHILIKHAVMHHQGTAVFNFKGADIAKMYDLFGYAHDLSVLSFTDFGSTYDVQVAGTPEAVRNTEFRHFSLYECSVVLRRTGYIT